MSKTFQLISLLIFIFPACDRTTNIASAESPEQLMSSWEGEWDTEVSFKKSALIPEAMTLKGKETNKWILNKKFMQSEQVFAGGAFKKLGLVRYEPNEDVFLFWDFDSNGSFPMGGTYGKWNKAKKEIVITGEYLGATGKGLIRLNRKDKIEIDFKGESENGTVLLDFEARSIKIGS